MGFREKVTLSLVIIIIIQIACRHCMPRTSSKSAYKPYLNIKSLRNKSSTPFSPSRVNKKLNPTFGKKSQNAKIRQNPPTKKSMYEAYNFPETEYPLDNSPSDSIYFGTNFNKKNQFNKPQKESSYLKKSAIDSLKRDIKMRRKLTSNKKIYMESPKKDMSSVTTFASGPESIRMMETGTFPEVQYPLNAMETWAPNYWYPLPFTQEEQKYDIGGLQPFKSKVSEDGKTPFVKVTRAKANKYLQSYDKLKEEQRRTSSLSSKRSNSGNTAFNFVKTATSEKHSDDFISSSMISSIPNNSSDTTKTVMQKTEIPSSSDNICPVIEYDYELVPIPYKVIEQDTENVCPAYELNSTKVNVLITENETMRATINKTQLVHTNTLTDDIRSTGSKIVSQEVVSTATDKISQQQNMEINIPEYTSTNGPSKEVVTLTPIDSVNNFSDEPIVEPPTPVSDDTLSDFLQNDMPVSTVHENSENALNAIPVPLTGPIPEIVPTNVSSPQTIVAPLSNHNTVSSTSIIIIPINNADGKSQPQIIETVGDAPIILYIPGSHNEHTTKSVHNHQPLTLVKSISNNLDCNIPDVGIPEVPNNTTYISYDMVTRFNENPSQSALVNKIPLIKGTSRKHVSNTESQFLKYETLPINSMCYNNENNPFSSREESPFNKFVLDTSPDSPSDKSKFVDSNFDTLPLPMDKTLSGPSPLSETPTDRLPILAKTHPPTPVSYSSSIPPSPIDKTVLPTPLSDFPTDRPLRLDKTIASTPVLDSPTDTLPLPMDKTLSPTPLSETPTDRLSILNKTYPPTPISDSPSMLLSPIESIVPPTPLSDIPTGGLLPLDKTIPSTPLSESPTYKPPMLEETLAPTPISDPPRILQSPIDNTIPPTPTPLTDLSTDGPLPLDMMTPSTPLLDPRTDTLPLLIDKTHPPTTLSETPTDRLLILGKTYPPTLISNSPSILPSTLEKTVPLTPLSDFSTDRPLPLDETIASTPVFNSPTHNLPLSIDKKLPATALSETLTHRPPMLEETLAPTLISDLLSMLPSSLENTIPSTQLTDLPIDGPLPLDKTIPSTSLFDSSTESLPLLGNKTLSPTPLSETPTDRLPRLNTTYPPISISDSPSILQSPSIVPPTPLSDIPTGGPLPLEKTLTSTPLIDTPSANLPLSIDKTIPSTPLSESPTYRPPMLEETLTPTPISDHPSILSSPIENIIPPTPLTNLPTDGTLPLDITIPSTPLLDPPTDTLLLLIDKTLQTTSLTEIPADSLPILGKTYPPTPISDSPGMLTSPIENTVPPTPPSDFSTDRPLPLDKTIAFPPIFDSPTHNLPLSIDKILPATALLETLTDRPPMIDETLATTPISDLPSILPSSLENTIPPTQLTDLPTDGPLPLDKTIPSTPLLDSYTKSLPVLVNKTLPSTPLSDTPTDRLPILNKSHPPTSVSYLPNNPSPVENIVPSISLPDFPTNRTLSLDKTLTSNPLLDPSTDTLSLPMDKTLPPTLFSETPTNLPSMFDETLSAIPISVPFNILPSTMEKTPTPFSDFAPMKNTLPSSPLLKTPSDRLSILDKTLSPTPISDPPNILPSPIEKTVLTTVLFDPPIDGPLSLDKMLTSTPLLDTPTETPPTMDEMFSPTSLLDTPTDKLPILKGKTLLPTPTSTILLSPVELLLMDDLPLPVDTIPRDIPLSDVSNDKQLPLDKDSILPTYELLPVNEFSELSTDFRGPINYLPSPVADLSPIPLSEVQVDDTPPEDEVHINTSTRDDSKDSMLTSMDGFPLLVSEIIQDTSLSSIPNDDLPHLFVVDKTPPETDYFDISSSDLSSPINLPPPINKALPDIQFTDLGSNELALLNYDLSLPVDKDTTLPDMQKFDNSLPLSVDRLPTDIPSDHLLLPVQSGLSHNPTDSIPLSLDIGLDTPESSILSVDKVLSGSKLPITKALLENVFSEITQSGLIMLEGKNPRSSSLALFKKLPIDMTLVSEPFWDTTSDGLQIPLEHSLSELPLSDMTEKSLPLPVYEILTDTILSDKTVDNLPISRFAENYLLLPEFEIPTDELPSPIEIMRPDLPNILTSDDEKVKKATFSANPTNDMPLLLHKKLPPLQIMPDSPQLAINKELSASELPVTKALLENVLSDIIKIVVSLPEEKTVSVSSLSKLLTKDLPSNKKLPDYLFPEIAGEFALLQPVLSDNSTDGQLILSDKVPPFLDNPSDYLSQPTENKFALSNNSADSHHLTKATAHPTKSQITKALLENVLSDISSGGLSVPKSPITSLSKISSKDLHEVKPIYNDLPLSMDNPFQENELPDTIKDNTGLSKDTIIQINPLSNNFIDSLPSTDTLLPDNGLSETPTDNLEQ